MVKAGSEQLIIRYNVKGEDGKFIPHSPLEIVRPKNHKLPWHDKDKATKGDARAIAHRLLEEDPQAHHYKDGKSVLRVSRISEKDGQSRETSFHMWDHHTNHYYHRERTRLLKKTKKEMAKNIKAATQEGRKQERDYYEEVRHLDPERRKTEFGQKRATAIASLRIPISIGKFRPFHGLRNIPIAMGRDDRIAEALIANVDNPRHIQSKLSTVTGELENGVLDPRNEIHGAGDNLATTVKNLKHGIVGNFISERIYSRFPLIEHIAEFSILLEKVTSPDSKEAFAKLLGYTLFYNWATGRHDANAAYLGLLKEVGTELREPVKAILTKLSDSPVFGGAAREANKEIDRFMTYEHGTPLAEPNSDNHTKLSAKKHHPGHWLARAALPSPSVFEEMLDRKSDRQDMIAMSLLQQVLEEPTDEKTKANPVYMGMRMSLAESFYQTMTEEVGGLRKLAREGMNQLDGMVSGVTQEIEHLLPGEAGISQLLFGRPVNQTENSGLQAEYDADGKMLANLYDNGVSKKAFLDATMQLAQKYVKREGLTPLQRELWRQAQDYGNKVNTLFKKSEKIAHPQIKTLLRRTPASGPTIVPVLNPTPVPVNA